MWNSSRFILVRALVCILIAGGSAFGIDIEYESLTVGLAPSVGLSATYDSNSKLSLSNKQSDVFLQTQLGLNLNIVYEWLNVNAVGYSYTRTYSVDTDEGQESLSSGEQVGLSFGRRDKVVVGLNQSYERATDYSLLTQPISAATPQPGDITPNRKDWSERTPRYLWRMGMTLGRDLSDKIEGDIGYTYSKNSYSRSDLNDSERNAGQLKLGYKVTDKSSLFLDGRYAIENSQGYENAGSDRYIGPGFQTHMTEKVNFVGSVGYESYRSGTLKGQNETSDVNSIGLHLGGTWRPVDKLTIAVRGDRGIESSPIDANTREVTLYGVTTGYRLTDYLNCSLMLFSRQDDYAKSPPGGTQARSSNSEGSDFAVGYQALPFLTIHGSISYEITQSNLPDEDYDQFRATIGANARF